MIGDCLFHLHGLCRARSTVWTHYFLAMLWLAECFHIHYLIYFSSPLTFYLITYRKRKQVPESLRFISSKWLYQNPNIGILAPNKAFYFTTKFAVLDVIVI